MRRKGSPLTDRYINPVYDAIREAVGPNDRGYFKLSREDIALIFDIIAQAQNDYTPGEICREIALSEVLGQLDIPEPVLAKPTQCTWDVLHHTWYNSTEFVPPNGMRVLCIAKDRDYWFDKYSADFGWHSPIAPAEFFWSRMSSPLISF
jgi:hypothetical protein